MSEDTQKYSAATNLVASETSDAGTQLRYKIASFSPDDYRYGPAELVEVLSLQAELWACIQVQRALLATRVEFGKAEPKHLAELDTALTQIDIANIPLLEEQITKHDQLAIIEEIGRHVSAEVKALLHPGTTSYDILDTARAYLIRRAWHEHLAPMVLTCCEKLCELSELFKDVLQTGRTHLQNTTPIPFGATLAQYAARLGDRFNLCNDAVGRLRGKVSGIVGSGASIAIVIGTNKSLAFEQAVLSKFGLEPDLTATQVTQKERVADVGHQLATLMTVLGDFANDMRLLYSSAINEVTSRDAQKRLGGSSADASKNNPINWENIAGKTIIVQSGMPILYNMISTDLQRDLRASVMARYQPQAMFVQIYESFQRATRALDQLSVNKSEMETNLIPVRRFPSEAMVAILRAHGYTHPEHGVGHSAVKAFARRAKETQQPLVDVAREDSHFNLFYQNQLTEIEQRILQGELELYLGSSLERRLRNIAFVKDLINKFWADRGTTRSN